MKFGLILAIAALVVGGCAKKNDTTEAVKKGVIRDISKSFNMSNMDVNVASVSFRDKEADAVVTYTVKGGTPDQGMSMKYVMERHDDGEWYIKSRASMDGRESDGSNPHSVGGIGGGGQSPAPMSPAPMASPSTNGQALPPGHPPIGQKQ